MPTGVNQCHRISSQWACCGSWSLPYALLFQATEHVCDFSYCSLSSVHSRVWVPSFYRLLMYGWIWRVYNIIIGPCINSNQVNLNHEYQGGLNTQEDGFPISKISAQISRKPGTMFTFEQYPWWHDRVTLVLIKSMACSEKKKDVLFAQLLYNSDPCCR